MGDMRNAINICLKRFVLCAIFVPIGIYVIASNLQLHAKGLISELRQLFVGVWRDEIAFMARGGNNEK